MPPKKLINKSRPIGSKKRPGRPPGSGNKPKPQDTPASTSTPTSKPANSPQDSPALPLVPAKTATNATNPTNAVLRQPQSFTDLSQVNNTLTFPKFDPNSYFATDLFKDTSALERTTKESADELVQSIEEKRQTVRVAVANLQLNQDVVRAGNEYLKLEGLAIDHATVRINNEVKFVNYEVAGLNKEIAINKFDQANERLTQGQKVLNGMRLITPLIDQEWQQRKSLKESQINSLKILAVQAKQALEPAMTQLSQEFKQELDNLN